MSRGAIALLALISALPLAAQRWQMQYFYDQNKSSMVIADLKFPSARRGIAVGYIQRGTRQEPTSLVTSDGGAHWRTVAVKELPYSLFFLNEATGWMVTSKGIWRTAETGNTWTKLGKTPTPVVRVYFIDEKTGWAVGPRKAVYQTADGGVHWSKLEAAAEPPGDPLYSAYTWVAFASPKLGLISGFNQPPRRTFGEERPVWLDPEAAARRRELPHLNYTLFTRDGGKTWHANSSSLFGQTTKVYFAADGNGLGLVEFGNAADWASEIYKIDWHTGNSTTVYRDHHFSVSDMWIAPGGTAYLAGDIAPGRVRDLVPGRVQVLVSKDFKDWKAMPVDYRASATRVVLAVAGDDMWLATDGGMILKLVK